MKIEIEGGIGELDYGGITVEAADQLVRFSASTVLLPEVRRRIHKITGETERAIDVSRVGFFNPRGTIEPLWQVVIKIVHGVVLEYGWGGKYSYMRTAARSRKVKKGISYLVKHRLGPELKAQIRKRKRRK